MEQKSKWQHQPRWNGDFSWVNTAFLLATPALALALLPVYLIQFGFAWSDFAIFSFMIFTTGFSITAGYHRLFAHQTYEAHPLVRLFFLIFGAGGFQNSAFKWGSDHRYHHRFVDKEGDPYNINRGFFYAHMGWIFKNDPAERSFANALDLEADPLVRWQHRNFMPLAVTIGFLLPTFLGWLVGRTFAGFFIGGLVRLLFLHHAVFLINSLAHVVGTRPYSTKVSARDSWWLAFLTNGEGFHNFHHAFANDYRNGVRWFHWDPTKWMIWSLHFLSLSKNLSRTPDAHILKAKLETSSEALVQDWRDEVPVQLEAMREAIELRLQEFQKKYREFQTWRDAMILEGKRSHRVRAKIWARRLRAERKVLEQSIREYRWMIQQLQRGALQL
jgi:stearoyl-CoA desaturase (delta-9 desaturase)